MNRNSFADNTSALNEFFAQQHIEQTRRTMAGLVEILNPAELKIARDDLLTRCRQEIIELLGADLIGTEQAQSFLDRSQLSQAYVSSILVLDELSGTFSLDQDTEFQQWREQLSDEDIESLLASITQPAFPLATVQTVYLPTDQHPGFPKRQSPIESERGEQERSNQYERTSMVIDLLSVIGFAPEAGHFSAGIGSETETGRSPYTKIVIPRLGITFLVCDHYENQTFILPATDLPVETITKAEIKTLPGVAAVRWSSDVDAWRREILTALGQVSKNQPLTTEQIISVQQGKLYCDKQGSIVFDGTTYMYMNAFADLYRLDNATVNKYIKEKKLQRYQPNVPVFDNKGNNRVHLYALQDLLNLGLKPTRRCDADGTFTYKDRTYTYPQAYAKRKTVFFKTVMQKIVDNNLAPFDCNGAYTFLDPTGRKKVQLYDMAQLEAFEWPERTDKHVCDKNGTITIDNIVYTYIAAFSDKKSVDRKVIVAHMNEKNIRPFNPGFNVFDSNGTQKVILYRLDELEALDIQNRFEKQKCDENGTIVFNGIVYTYIRNFARTRGLNQGDVLDAANNKGLSSYDPGYAVYDPAGNRKVHLYRLEDLQAIESALNQHKKES